eukprot:TRINITY_DN7465_c0_g1_i1.p1 TRINITY_DN7465_c0_g1~~TRINITY_DN7465_c0_g1_i1.p1  ORF type:complete len:198 (-),score=44.45 TRINITY_DN7465_c0_g1_i1:50-643(-)
MSFEKERTSGFQQLLKYLENKDWVDDGVNKGVKVSHLDVPNSSMQAFRGEYAFKGNAEDFWNKLWTLTDAQRKELDRDIVEFKAIQTGEEFHVFHQVNSLPWPLWSRDFVSLHFHLKEGTKFYDVYVPVELAEVPPNPEKLVRAEIICFGYEIQQEGDMVKAVKIVHADPKGNLPALVVNTIAKSQTVDQLIKMTTF